MHGELNPCPPTQITLEQGGGFEPRITILCSKLSQATCLNDWISDNQDPRYKVSELETYCMKTKTLNLYITAHSYNLLSDDYLVLYRS